MCTNTIDGLYFSVPAAADGHLAEEAVPKEIGRLQRQVVSVTEENNLLRYKVELLLDMVSLWESHVVCPCMTMTAHVLHDGVRQSNVKF